MSSDSLKDKGFSLIESGKLQDAADMFSSILEKDSLDAESYLALGSLLCELGDISMGLSHIDRAIQLDPNYPDAFVIKGKIFLSQKQLREAAEHFARATILDHDYAEAWSMLGHTLGLMENYSEALVASKKALAIDQNLPDALLTLGHVHANTGDIDEAINTYRILLRILPNHPVAWITLARLHVITREYDEAQMCFEKAISIMGESEELLTELGNLYVRQERLDKARACFHKVIARWPDSKTALIDLALVYQKLNNINQAQTYLSSAYRSAPKDFNVLSHLANFYVKLKNYDAAKNIIRETLSHFPNNPDALSNLGMVSNLQGDVFKANEYFSQASHARPDSERVLSKKLFNLNYIPSLDAREICKEHQEWESRFGLCEKVPGKHKNNIEADKVLTVGYISPDLYAHPVSYFFAPILKNHNHKRFKVICYSDTQKYDRVTEVLKSYATLWRETNSLSNEELSQLIIDDAVDILVDLAGHNDGNRLKVFAAKPAPLQMTYLGYPTTTGLSSIDYLITDRVADPHVDIGCYSEELLYLDKCFVCYEPPYDAPEVVGLPARQNGSLTFGCMNSLAKINRCVIDLWVRLLKECATSKLLIFRDSISETQNERIREQFIEQGISAERLFVFSKMSELGEESCSQHLLVYNHIDVLLDVFPWSGHTTNCEAMWMGVPVVTLADKTRPGRLGASVLSAVGLNRLISSTPDEYVKIAKELSNDIAGLEILRSTLRDCMRNSTLCDAVQFTRRLESGYHSAWMKRVAVQE